MRRKKKVSQQPLIISELAQEYFELWTQLERCKTEPEYDVIRRMLNEIWICLSDRDKRDFSILSRDK